MNVVHPVVVMGKIALRARVATVVAAAAHDIKKERSATALLQIPAKNSRLTRLKKSRN
jgi:hypothetical protein